MKVFQNLTILFDLFCFCKFHQWLWLWALPICPLSIPSRWSDIHLHRVSGRFQSWALGVFSNTFGFLSKQPFDQQKLGTQLPNASRTFPDTLPIDHRKHMETLISSRCGWSMSCLLRVTHPLKWLASQQNHNFLTGWKRQKCAGLRRAWRPSALWSWQCFSRKCLPSFIGTSCTPWISSVYAIHLVIAGFGGFWTKADEQTPDIFPALIQPNRVKCDSLCKIPPIWLQLSFCRA